ncbi:MAG TPA: protein-export chaperone SecB [Xanthobacteraceae bacterium]|jgi:preprotein translocase subunit SecB|nr:protein-export chaperone SecB [Xanthobacteraceae bacterium]
MSTTNGGPQPQIDPSLVPRVGVLTQYVKDMSFENPNAPRSMGANANQPAININIGVEATPMSETDIEVTLRLEGKAESQGQGPSMVLFAFELLYSGLFRLENVPQESLQPTVMIECPRILFPFAREIIATATRNGGFPPLLLEPIDFVTLYRQRMEAAQPAFPPVNPN